MNPFYVFDLPWDTTDQQVEARYQELIRRYPPDRAGREFNAIRKAYESLATERDRLRTRLFHVDKTATLDPADVPASPPDRPIPRFTSEQLARIARGDDR
jgi:hypothetical protein